MKDETNGGLFIKQLYALCIRIVIDEAHSELSHPREKAPNWRHSG
jgi:hypothetical protein